MFNNELDNKISISFPIKDLEEAKTKINNIEEAYKKLNICKNQLTQYPSEQSKKLIDEINNYKDSFKQKNNITQDNFQKYSENLKKIFYSYYSYISNIYKNNYIENIKSLNKDLKDIIDNIIQFEPSLFDDNGGSFDDEINYKLYDKKKNYENFYGNDDTKSNTKEFETTLKCNFCSSDNVNYYCNHCNFIFCNECGANIMNYINNKPSLKNIEACNLKKLTEVKAENEEMKNKFIESYINIFKRFAFKCSYIMKNQNVNYVDQNTYKKFQYPSITDIEDPQKIVKFLKDIDELEKIIREKIDIKKSIDNKDISWLLKEQLKKALNLYNTLQEIDFNFNSDDYENVNKSDDDFLDEKFHIGGDEEEEKKKTNDNNFEKFSNNFKYLIYLINNKNYDTNNNIINDLKGKIIKALQIKEENISISPCNGIPFINYFIKTKDFSQLSPKIIRFHYPELKLLYEYKLLIDGFIRYKCQIQENKINYNYNFIIPNISLNNERNKETYNPPYGWLGVALNVENLYKNEDLAWLNKDSQWAICYYGFDFKNKFDTSENIRVLKEIINNNNLPKNDIFNIKFNYKDIRNSGKKIGNGYYLSPYIDIAEKYSGIISFNNKKYKIVLMAKVLIEKIKEPDDGTFWIINDQNNIKFYRILFKEVIIDKRRKKHI